VHGVFARGHPETSEQRPTRSPTRGSRATARCAGKRPSKRRRTFRSSAQRVPRL